MFQLKFFVLILFISAASIYSRAAENFSSEKIHKVSQSRYWKKLLHYRSGWVAREKSEADGLDFFLSPMGQSDLESELSADLLAFENPNAVAVGPLHQHPQCAFPERYRFLKNEFHLNGGDQTCLKFKEWKERFHPQSVTLIYASSFLSNPASMFGHTFLRIDSAPRKGQTKKNDLLDYGISFDAITGPDPDVAFALKGLFGLYPGNFSQLPYFIKINAYTSMDNRDLWEYQLDLSEAQIDHLLNHLWEVSLTYFDYYFFNKNCSYQLMALLEVANPDWDLARSFRSMTIPIDTVRALKNQNAIRSVHYRPSLLHTIQNQLAQMNEIEVARFYETRNEISQVKESDSAKTLDALMDWQKYKAMESSLTADEAEKKIDQRLLLIRSKKENTTNNLSAIFAEPAQADFGHKSSKISIFGAEESKLGVVGFELRPTLHDSLDPDIGYLSGSELIIGRTRASLLMGGQNKLRLDELTFGEVVNNPVFTRLEKSFSWNISSGVYRPLDTGCADCIAIGGHGGVGYTFGSSFASSISLSSLTFTSLITLHAEVSSAFHDIVGQSYRAGPGVYFETQAHFNDRVQVIAAYEQIRYLPGPNEHYLSRVEAAAAYGFSSYEVRVNIEQFISPILTSHLVSLNLGHYF